MHSTTLAHAALMGSLYSAVTAMQPDAAKPQAAPMRDLTWGQLNFLHTTDTHGWLGGHVSEHQYSADWGDYVSFAHHMRQKADDANVDLLLVDSGDRVEGNGLYDGSLPKGEYTYDIYRQQDVDIICMGNHELYVGETADREHAIQVPNFADRYVASNLDYVDRKTGERSRFAQRYREFKTKNLGLNVVAFGFLFDFTGNQNNTIVQRVEATVEEDWFQEAIRKKPDVFVVVGHVGVRMPELKTVYTAIRKQNWHTPIAIFAGHAHVRDAMVFDSKAMAMASGRYFETVGWMSVEGIDKKNHVQAQEAAGASVKFTRRYLDNNLFGYHHHSGLNATWFPTEKGQNTSALIYKARQALRLDTLLGCAPKSLWMNRVGYPDENSIYSWLANESLAGIYSNGEREGKASLGFMNTGGVRFDIIRGRFTSDSLYNVSPFTSKIVGIKDVPYKAAKKIIDMLNSSGPIFAAANLADVRMMGQPEAWSGHNFGVEKAASDSFLNLELRGETQQQPLMKPSDELTAGYTTKDDIGSDGDDTVHAPIAFHQVPNAVVAEVGFPEEGEPEVVDVVFIDFLKPWVLAALKFAGGDYSEKDVVGWKKGSFSENLGEWIMENWKGDC